MTPASLGFHAAAGGVTGSCALLDWAGLRVLVDCGMPDDAGAGSEPFGFDPATIDVVLLTHAHYDHCGALPWLVQRGFRGRILATAATRDLVQLVLLDAAQVLHEAARSPSFDAHDVEAVMTRFDPPVVPGTLVALAPGLSASFHDAGHILGSASVRLQGADGDGGTASVAFSGDLGHAGRPLLDAPDAPPASDVAVIETTYGDRVHRPLAASVDALHDAIAATLTRGGQVVIPAFALERAQEILYYLREGVASGRLPAEVPVYLDSPMAIAATALFGRHREACAARLRAMFDDGDDPFGLPGLQRARTPEASSKIHRGEAGRQPAVIIAGSGMCTGGRVLHHLARLLPGPAAAVVFVGHASAGTLARRLRDGAEVVSIFGDQVPVRARIHVIDGLSAHADRAELCAWHRRVAPARTFLVHGEPASMHGLAAHLERTEVVMPGPRACYELFPRYPAREATTDEHTDHARARCDRTASSAPGAGHRVRMCGCSRRPSAGRSASAIRQPGRSASRTCCSRSAPSNEVMSRATARLSAFCAPLPRCAFSSPRNGSLAISVQPVQRPSVIARST